MVLAWFQVDWLSLFVVETQRPTTGFYNTRNVNSMSILAVHHHKSEWTVAIPHHRSFLSPSILPQTTHMFHTTRLPSPHSFTVLAYLCDLRNLLFWPFFVKSNWRDYVPYCSCCYYVWHNRYTYISKYCSFPTTIYCIDKDVLLSASVTWVIKHPAMMSGSVWLWIYTDRQKLSYKVQRLCNDSLSQKMLF